MKLSVAAYVRSTEKDVIDQDEIRALLAALNQRQRAALVLRFYGGFDDVEIAENLGCRTGTFGV